MRGMTFQASAESRSASKPGSASTHRRGFFRLRISLICASLLAVAGALAAAQGPAEIPPPGFRPLPASVVARLARPLAIPAAMPESLDWRDAGIITPPRNQQHCGACWAFAAIGCMEAMSVLSGASPSLDLSEQFLISCDVLPNPEYANFRNEGCCGGGVTVFEFLKFHPAIRENLFQYGDGDYDGDGPRSCDPDPNWNTVPCPAELPEHSGWRIATWEMLPASGDPPVASIGQMKAALQQGPVWLGYYIYEDFVSYWSSGDPSVPYQHVSGDLVGGHAVMAIGYNDVQGYWIVKNSWGNGGPFGDGTFHIAYVSQCSFGINATRITVAGGDVPVEKQTLGGVKALFR